MRLSSGRRRGRDRGSGRCRSSRRGRARRSDRRAVTEGASAGGVRGAGNSAEWAARCEDAAHLGHDGTADALAAAPRSAASTKSAIPNFDEKVRQLGSYGGGNHFGECEVVHVGDSDRARQTAEVFGLRDGQCRVSVALRVARVWARAGRRAVSGAAGAVCKLGRSRCPETTGSWFTRRWVRRRRMRISTTCALGANFATVNHMLINALVLEAFQEVIPGRDGELVYFISHNIARQEVVDNTAGVGAPQGRDARASRRAITRLAGTPFADDWASDPAAGQPARRVGGDGRRRGRREELLQREPRRGPPHGPQGRDSPAGSEDRSTRNCEAATC